MSDYNDDEDVSYYQAVIHMLHNNFAVCALLIIVQIIGLALFFNALPSNLTFVELGFLILMLLTFYTGSVFIYISQYKTKLETGITNPIWKSRYNKMTLMIALAVIVFAIINY